jgi:hypothetical protein
MGFSKKQMEKDVKKRMDDRIRLEKEKEKMLEEKATTPEVKKEETAQITPVAQATTTEPQVTKVKKERKPRKKTKLTGLEGFGNLKIE